MHTQSPAAMHAWLQLAVLGMLGMTRRGGGRTVAVAVAGVACALGSLVAARCCPRGRRLRLFVVIVHQQVLVLHHTRPRVVAQA